MTQNKRNLKEFDALVTELTKDEPNLEWVEKSMTSLGLKYSTDPLERLNTVLLSVQPQLQREKESEI